MWPSIPLEKRHLVSNSFARGYQARSANMAARRERILEAARHIIAINGFDSLSLRELAMSAEVTVPTIYNLIGNKAALVEALFDETITPFENLQYIPNDSDPVAGPEDFLQRVISTMHENENYYRAEFLARDRLADAGDTVALSIQKRIVQIAIEACGQATAVGLTAGKLSTQQLGLMIADHFLLAYRDWAHGRIDLDNFSEKVVIGTYICLAADASPNYRDEILEKLNAWSTTKPVTPLP